MRSNHIKFYHIALAPVNPTTPPPMDSYNTSPPAGTMTADCLTAPAAIEKSKKGPAFTSAEDLIVARAFIAASENAICGAHQKGKVFKLHMFELYKELINEQNKANQALLEQSSHGSREEYLKRGVGLSFSHRSAESIFNRFKSQISTEVMKNMGITETTEMASGWSMDVHDRGMVMCLISIHATNNSKARTSSQPFGQNVRRIALERDQLGKRRPDRLNLMQSLSRQSLLKWL